MFGFANTSKFDRVARVFFAAILIALGVMHGATAPLGIIAIVAGIGVLITAITGLCPIYKLFGICTNSPDSAGFAKVPAKF